MYTSNVKLKTKEFFDFVQMAIALNKKHPGTL